MIAVLLCGGESSRFAPLKEKNCAPFFGKPLVEWHIEQLKRLGFSAIVVVANESNEFLIQEALRSYEGVSIVVQKGNGQAQALMSCRSHFGEAAVFVLNGSDIYDDAFLGNLIDSSKDRPQDILLGAVERKLYFPGGYLKLNGTSVHEIIEKPKPGTEPSNVVRIVADIFPSGAELVSAIGTNGSSDQSGYESAVNTLIASGKKTQAVIAPEFAWLPIKYPWDVLSAMSSFFSSVTKQQIARSAQISKNVVLDGPIVIEEGVKILENTKIVGPCYIGQNTIIGNNNIIRASHIGADCVTGFNTDITRSYVGDACWFHSNYIGDSVLAGNVSMGSGTVLANLRLDDGEIFSLVKKEKIATGRNKLGAIIGESVRIGVNASIMPGVKIGANSFIGAGIVLDRDVDTDSFCMGKTGAYTVKKNTNKKRTSREEFKSKL